MSNEYGTKPTSPDRPRYYEILCVSHDATPEEIKSAYRKRARETHPDLNPEKNRKEFQLVSEAYEVLSDETKRLLYDRSLRVVEARAPQERQRTPHASWAHEYSAYPPAREYRPADPDPAVQKKLKEHEEDYFKKKQENTQEYQRKRQENERVYKEKMKENERAYQEAQAKNEERFKKEQTACEDMRKQFLRQPGNNYSVDNGYYTAKDKASREYHARKEKINSDYFTNKERINQGYFAKKDRIEQEYFVKKDRIDQEYVSLKEKIEQGSYSRA